MTSPGTGRVIAKRLPSGGNGLETMIYQYPLKLISPTASSGSHKSALVFLLSYGGGLVAGDAVNLSIDVQDGAKLSLVTQGHTKVFKSPSADVVTSQSMHVRMAQHSALCLLPDPVQPFEDSVYRQTQIFRMAHQSSLCLLDWVTAGRIARGEHWSLHQWTGRNEVWLGGPGQTSDRLLIRDIISISAGGSASIGLSLKDTMDKIDLFGSLILQGPLMEALGRFFLAEFESLPRLGAREFRSKQSQEEQVVKMSDLDHWRAQRLEQEKQHGILWSAAPVRGCVVIKFSSPTVEAGRDWIRSMLLREGSIASCFGEEALMCLR